MSIAEKARKILKENPKARLAMLGAGLAGGAVAGHALADTLAGDLTMPALHVKLAGLGAAGGALGSIYLTNKITKSDKKKNK